MGKNFNFPIKAVETGYNWKKSLPDCDYHVVSVIIKGGYIYAGSHGYVYKLDTNGNLIATNNLPDRGNYEVRLALTNTHLVVGTNGYVVLVDLNDFGNTNKNINISLPDCGNEIVTVITSGNYIYAGSNGYVYQLDINGNLLAQNGLPDRGNHEVRLALTDTQLVVGIYGYVVLINLNDFSKTKNNKNISLPDCDFNIVSVMAYKGLEYNNDAKEASITWNIYTGSNGYVYKLDQYGNILYKNTLPERGDHEVRMVMASTTLAVGIHGYAIGLDPNNLHTYWQTSLPHCNYEIVSVCFDSEQDILYAGSNGYVYTISYDGGEVLDENSLPDLGNHEIRMSVINDQLYVGSNGYVVSPVLPTYNNWMAELKGSIGNKTLNNIFLPGTHNSGTYNITKNSDLSPDFPDHHKELEYFVKNTEYGKSLAVAWSKCQDFNITAQLKAGIRYFDLRISPKDNELYTCHSLYGDSLKNILDKLKNFLNTNKQEIVILDFQKFYKMDKQNADSLVNLLVKTIGDKIINRNSSLVLNDIWNSKKQVFVIMNFEQLKAYQSDIRFWPNYPNDPKKTDISIIISNWFNKHNIKDLETAILKEIKENHNDKLWVLQCILTPSDEMIIDSAKFWEDWWEEIKEFAEELKEKLTFGLWKASPVIKDPDGIIDLAEEVRPLFNDLPYYQTTDKLNIVIADFFQMTTLISKIYKLNR